MGTIKCGPPNSDLYSFNGTISLDANQVYGLSAK